MGKEQPEREKGRKRNEENSFRLKIRRVSEKPMNRILQVVCTLQSAQKEAHEPNVLATKRQKGS
jgi:hypothetical protein